MTRHIGSSPGIPKTLSLLAGLALTALAVWGGGASGGPSGDSKTPLNRKAAFSRKMAFSDLTGKRYSAQDIAAHKASVFFFISSQCPVSNVYAPRLQALASDYGRRDVQAFAVYSDRQESRADVLEHAKQHSLAFPIVKDTGNTLADSLGAKTTPEAIIVDARGEVRYRGRIDDNSVATRVTSHDLNDALDAVLAGKPVAHPRTVAFGCAIRRAAAPAPAARGVPTYAHDVAAILRSKCESCHRPGEVAPFSLQTYTQASAWAADIKKYTQNRQMPPWKPVPGYGDFKEEHDRTLTEAELLTITRWADAGAPLGNPKEIPAPRKFTQGWRLGEPDLEIVPEKAYRLAADGDDVYRNFVIKSNLTEDRFVRAVECRPGNRAVVHHIIAFIDGGVNGTYASESLEGKDKDGQPGYTSFGGPGFVPTGMLGGWAPGNDPRFLPDGIGVKVPKGARIVIQVHYHKDGKPETDLSKLGVHFCRTTVDKRVDGQFALNFLFNIPPGDPHYEAKATMPIMEDSHVLAVTPHMHLLGREMKVWATLPDGVEKPLVWIKDWDFNWQMTYLLQEPMALPKGSKIHLVAYYDNSDKNPRNPNKAKPRAVGWGEQTTDEMCIAFVTLTHDQEHLAQSPGEPPVRTVSTSR
jgi:peroxiredoxin